MTDRGVAIVTGASGIGLAIAKALLLGDGGKLILADMAPLDAARAELEPLRANATQSVIMDVANEASASAALAGCEDGFGPVRSPRCPASAAISAGRPMAPPRSASSR